MAINSIAMNAYKTALQDGQKLTDQTASNRSQGAQEGGQSFMSTLTDSLSKVNELQQQKAGMIESFASGETQNVHELMISMQKASVAMSMTSAVRGKVMQAYQEIMRMQF
jgi:flagellar hook-basal body complex protein FliE